MARQPRFVLPGQPHHVVQRGLDGLVLFRDDDDFDALLKLLAGAARDRRIAVHAYALLPSRLHLLLTPPDAAALSQLMKTLGGAYVRRYNDKYHRHGTLWEGRFRAAAVEAGTHLLDVMRAIELAPVAARLAASPEDYPWSTYRHHAGMAANPFVSDHAGYWQLGNTPFDREAAYRALAAGGLPAERQAAVERSWRSGLPLGGEAYRQQIAAVTGRRTEPGRPGRPRKRSPDHPSSVPN